MKFVFSKHIPKNWLKRRKKDEAKLTTYWANLYPEPYAKDMTRDYLKKAMSLWRAKFASDAKDVIFVGNLRQASDGFVYVDVPNSIFDGFIPLIPGAEKPPKNEKHYDDIGAHISVIKRSEAEALGIKLENVDQKIPYIIRGIEEVLDPDGWDEMAKVWFLKVEAPGLEKVRERYGLPPRIKGHDFHITIAVQRRSTEKHDA